MTVFQKSGIGGCLMKRGQCVPVALVVAILMVLPVSAETLYEFYTTASTDKLEAETRDMGDVLKTAFSQSSVARRQQEIDFSEYLSNLKKTFFYARKLATYSDYETDLEFARDNEIFKGLPEEENDAEGGTGTDERKVFLQEKYERMTKNVQDESETYEDLIYIALDACENLAENDLSGIFENSDNQASVLALQKKEADLGYLEIHGQLDIRWPGLAGRIDDQLDLWIPEPPSPEDPIINPEATEAI